MRSARFPRRKEQGVAIVTALLLTTLAITIVASLFWQQQVQVRSIENQRLQLQKQWILRGALDWTKLILREDYRIMPNNDNLTEPWAVTLAETRLDQYVENNRVEGDVGDATLSGGITDAQARLNLKNLVGDNGVVVKEEVNAFGRLLTNLQLNPVLAQATADAMATAIRSTLTQPSAQTDAGGQSGQTAQATQSTQSGSGPQPMPLVYVDDLLAVPGFTPEALNKLREFITILPVATKVNMNTAPAEVLAARMGLSSSEAMALVAARRGTYFKDLADMRTRLPGKSIADADAAQLDVRTNYFFVNGNVRLSRAGMQMQALIRRPNLYTEVVWIREN